MSELLPFPQRVATLLAYIARAHSADKDKRAFKYTIRYPDRAVELLIGGGEFTSGSPRLLRRIVEASLRDSDEKYYARLKEALKDDSL